MAMTFEMIRDIFEILYFISGIILAVAAVYALKELKFHKDNALRVAATETARQCDFFADNIINISNHITEVFKKNQVPLKYGGPIQELSNDNKEVTNWIKTHLSKLNIQEKSEILKLLNSMESFSIYFIHGICDENIAYNPISKTYINIVERLYPVIYTYRLNNDKYFSNILGLYTIWKAKFEKESLTKKSNDLFQEFINTTEAAASKEIPELKTIGVESKNKKK